jgi:hypothetical protein
MECKEFCCFFDKIRILTENMFLMDILLAA